MDKAWLVGEIEAITGYVTASPARDPEAPVLIPGDPERQMRAQRLVEGIPVDDVASYRSPRPRREWVSIWPATA